MSSLRERVQAVIAAGGSLDQEVLAELSQAWEDPSLKALAERAFRLCARQFRSTRLKTFFEFVPWDRESIYEREAFQTLYNLVAEETSAFNNISPHMIRSLLLKKPSSLLIFRLILGYSLDELELVLASQYSIQFRKNDLREIEIKGEKARPSLLQHWTSQVAPSLASFLYDAAFGQTFVGASRIDERLFRRRIQVLGIDPAKGWKSVAQVAGGVSFYELLYQRYIEGFVRQALDISSAIKADLLEAPLTEFLRVNGIPFYKTRAREHIEGWEQAPDFLIPTKEEPQVVIEAKVAEDGGTARDKAGRIERLARMARRKGIPCIAVIDGKGFRRINDVLVPILRNCQGRVFTYSSLQDLLTLPEISRWVGKASSSK